MAAVAWWVAGSIAVSAVIVCASEIDRHLSRRARRKLHESVRRHPSGKWIPVNRGEHDPNPAAVVLPDSEWARWDAEAAAMNTPIYDGVADEHAALIAELDLRLLARKFSAQEVDDARLHSWMENGR